MGRTDEGVVNWTAFAETRDVIGPDFLRILGFYREDAVKSVLDVEQAFRARDAIGVVRPAHKLKGDSLQFGAEGIGRLAEHIEHVARQCVEDRRPPDELATDVPRLRPMLIETLNLFEREMASAQVTPLRRAAAPTGFGRKRSV